MNTYDSLLAAITPAGGETREVFDPATGERIGTAPVEGLDDLHAAIDRAESPRQGLALLLVSPDFMRR